jgi:Cu-Zn family superoxide dismutase
VDLQRQRPTRGIAVVAPASGSSVKGTLRFELVEDGVRVTGEVTGLPPSSKHGFHIHEFGDMSAVDGLSMGGHFNPEDMAHGLPDNAARHAGDMGNIESDAHGVAKVDRTIAGMGMSGRSSIFGRGIVVHEKPDDGGQPTGNAGSRIGYGVIGVAKMD